MKTLKQSRSGNRPHGNEIFCLLTVARGYTIFSFEYSVGWAERVHMAEIVVHHCGIDSTP